MKVVGIDTYELSPAVQGLLEGFRSSASRPLPRRERAVEAAGAVGLLAVAAALPALLWSGAESRPAVLLAFVLAYAATSRVRFGSGAGHTAPTQLVFVPMLLLVEPSLVPLLVAVAMLMANLPEYLTRKTHPERVLLSVNDAWHAVAPALVLALAGDAGPSLGDWPLYLLALGVQFGTDFAFSTAREWLALGVSPRLQPRLLGWVILVDLLLSPLGLLAALAAWAYGQPLLALLLLPLVALLAIFANERAARLDHALELSQAYHGTALLLSDVLEADDEYTGVHSRSVVALAADVAEAMGLDERERRHVEFGALLHDIGKIAVPKEIINKTGPLSPDEWVVMETHTVEGQRMLDRVGGMLRDVGLVVRSSHERFDGGGYPDGLAGEAIPLGACIVSACDAFNAMTTDRSYRRAMPMEHAVAELQANAGTQFHPEVVRVLISVLDRPAKREIASATA